MIEPLLKIQTFNGLMPAIIDEVSEDLTYVGYLNPNKDAELTDDDLQKLAIKKIEKINTVTTIKWVGGSKNPSFVTAWSGRLTADYTF